MTESEIADLFARVDAVYDVLTDTPEPPSTIARRAHLTTAQTYEALRWLEGNEMLLATGNGAWRKYRTRPFGRYNRTALHNRKG